MARRLISGKTFSSFYDQDSGAVFSGLEFRKCHFSSCALSLTKDPQKRSRIRDVRLIGCSQRGCMLDPAIVEDVVVKDFDTEGQLVQVWAAAFKHVVLRGKIGRLMISPAIIHASDKVQVAFDNANAEYYKNVDWALDISKAEFSEFEVRGVPAKLIRRDPASQVIVTRKTLIKKKHWKKLAYTSEMVPFLLENNLDDGDAEELLIVAPKLDPEYKWWMEDIALLKYHGIAEPDPPSGQRRTGK